MSKYFCVLPWVHLRINQGGEVYPCCNQSSFYQYGNLKDENVEEVLNGSSIRDLRLKIQRGEKIKFCESCYKTEASGGRSYRQEMLDRFVHLQSRVRETSLDGNVGHDCNIISWDLRLSNICTLSCRSCNSSNSTAWGDGKVTTPFRNENEFLDYFKRGISSYEFLYFAGGEPLLDRTHYKVLEMLIENGRTEIELNYNTSLSSLGSAGQNIVSIWNKFKNVRVCVSVDGVEKQFEILRNGLSWKKLKSNFFALKKEAPHVSLVVNPTISAMNVFHLTTALKKMFMLEMISDEALPPFNIATDPRYINLNILNQKERNELKANFQLFLDETKLNFGDQLHRYLKREFGVILGEFNNDDFSKSRDDFRRFIFLLDKEREEKFVHAFPEHFNLLYSI